MLKRECVAELEAKGLFLQQGRHSRDGRQWWNTFRVVPLDVFLSHDDAEELASYPQIAYRKDDTPDWAAIAALAEQVS